MSVSLRQLHYFVAAAEAGTISGAAAREHISQSTIALAIGELERDLGVQLFIRRQAKGLTITQAGVSVLADARPLLAHAGELVASARSLGGELTGTLTVGCFTTLSSFLIARVLTGFVALHPAVKLDFVEGSQVELQQSLLDGRSELALLYDYDLQPGIHHETLYRTRPHILLPCDHPLAGRSHVSLRALADEPLVLLDNPPSRQYFTDVLDSVGIRPLIRHTTSNFETVRSLVARGLGYSLLIQQAASGVSHEGMPLVECPIEEEIDEVRVLIAWPDRVKLTKRARAFTNYCLQNLTGGTTHRNIAEDP